MIGVVTMAMRERFSDEEWTLVCHVPFDVFVLAALADKKVEESEVAAFTNTLSQAVNLKDQLHREVALDYATRGPAGITAELQFELTETSAEMMVRTDRSKAMLKEKLTRDEYQSFIMSALISGLSVAVASGKKQHFWHKKQQLSDEEANALAAFAAMWDLDVNALTGFLQ